MRQIISYDSMSEVKTSTVLESAENEIMEKQFIIETTHQFNQPATHYVVALVNKLPQFNGDTSYFYYGKNLYDAIQVYNNLDWI